MSGRFVFFLRLLFPGVLFGLGISSLAFGQSGIIQGRVLDKHRAAIGGVQILLNGTRFGAETDSSGTFSIGPVPHGDYRLIAFSFCCQTRITPVAHRQDSTRVEVVLETLVTNLDPVEVQAEREKTFGLDKLRPVENFGIYEGKKTEVVVMRDLTANLATSNARQIFGKVTGLNIWESDGAGLQLGIGGRGLSPNRTANFNVRQNGYDISADALGYPESYYTPPTEALERIEIVRGAASLQYGTQFGGMLNFRFRRAPQDSPLEVTIRPTLGSWGFLGCFASLGGTVAKGKLTYYTCLQFKQGLGYRPNSRFVYGNGFTSVGYQWRPGLLTSLEWTRMAYLARQPGGLTDRNFADNPRLSFRSRNWFQVDWNLLALTATWKVSSRLRFNLRNFGLLATRKALGNLERINIVDMGGNRTLIDGQFRNLGLEGRMLYSYVIGSGEQTLLVGFRHYTGQTTATQGEASAGSGPDFRFNNPENPENSRYRFPNRNLALFAEHIFTLNSRLTITPGIRLEYIRTGAEGYYRIRTQDFAGNLIAVQTRPESRFRQRSFFLGGIGVNWKKSELLQLYGNFSQNYRAINFSDLRIVNPNFVVDSTIRDERGFTADLGLKGKRSGSFSYEITAFLVFYSGKIGQILRAGQPPLFNDFRFRGNISDARNAGLEMFGELEILHWKDGPETGRNRGSVSLFGNLSVVDARYFRTDDPSVRNKKVELVPPLIFRTGIQLDKAGFRISAQVSHSARHFSDATNAVRTATAVEGIIPAYTVADISLRYPYRQFSFEMSVNNLTGTAYFTRRAEAYPGPGIIPADGRSIFFTVAWTGKTPGKSSQTTSPAR
jgi:Fe(3+) dicitrate transport protein